MSHDEYPDHLETLRRLQAQHRELQEKTYCLIYVGARMSKERGDDPEQIRAETMAFAAEGNIDGLDDDDREDHLDMVREAVDDALSGRPPKYPKWINMDRLNDPIEA